MPKVELRVSREEEEALAGGPLLVAFPNGNAPLVDCRNGESRNPIVFQTYTKKRKAKLVHTHTTHTHARTACCFRVKKKRRATATGVEPRSLFYGK